jgi:uncharacterized membrane protein HdeD (DUF308 family)
MKNLYFVLAVLFTLAGAVWFLQGINVLPGSFMTGNVRWAYYGVMSIIAGLAFYRFARNMKTPPPKE